MKNTTKRLFSLVLAVVMMAGLAITSSAAGIVTYEGKKKNEEFIFAPGTEYSVSDLFTDFKNLMPGDTTEPQLIRLVNNGKKGTTTKFYIKALGPAAANDEDLVFGGTNGGLGDADDTDGYTEKQLVQEFLQYVNLKVVKVKGDKTLFDAPADQTADLSDWVLLGSLRKGGEIDLEVTLEIPADIGGPEVDDNQFQDSAAAVTWAFKIEEIPDPPVPDTGDNTGAVMYAAMFGVAAMALIMIVILKKKKTEE